MHTCYYLSRSLQQIGLVRLTFYLNLYWLRCFRERNFKSRFSKRSFLGRPWMFYHLKWVQIPKTAIKMADISLNHSLILWYMNHDESWSQKTLGRSRNFKNIIITRTVWKEYYSFLHSKGIRMLYHPLCFDWWYFTDYMC